MAFFPAEVLVSLYQTIGDVRDVLVIASMLNDVLIFAAVTILLLALAGLRQRRYAVLRALGASRSYILLTVWIGAVLILVAGCLTGLGLAQIASSLVAQFVEYRTGLSISVAVGLSDALHVTALMAVGSLFALLPALAAFRTPVAETLRQG